MYDGLEQLFQFRKMCLEELKQAQVNCERYSSDMTVLTEKLSANWQATNSFLAKYDSFITNITTIMDATRKFNIHLHLYNMKLAEIQNIFLKTKQEESESACVNTEVSKETIRHFYPAEECDINLELADDFKYPTLNLSEVYKINQVISGTVTYIKNLKDLSFYIFDNSSKHREAVVELSKSLQLRQYHGLPTNSEVFGCVLDNQIFRAVLGCKKFYDVEMNEEIIPCYILDTGEILPLKSDHITYRLAYDQKIIPALAIPCQLKSTNKNPFVNMEKKLKTIEYKKCHFKVIAIESNILHVELVDSSCMTKENTSNNQPMKNVALENDFKRTDRIQLTEEELNILYEEPLNTSNAMRAVMGYDPQDDRRLCRFYNPSTGGCFKGVNCKLEHTLRQPDGWTKDVLPTSITDSQHPTTVFVPESIINITPTFVGQLDRFYAQINDPSKASHPLVWIDEDVPSWKRLQKPPHMFELVLSRYIDDLWYRAKIMSHDDEYKVFKVLYVDYGNTQVVHLRNLASIDINMAQLPFQAVLCRFENVNENPSLSADERKNFIEILCEMVLNKSMDVKVISHYEDLFISFLDKKTYPLPDVLIEMGCLKQH